VALGNLYKEAKRTGAAVEAFRRAALVEPDKAHVRLSLGDALAGHGEVAEAKAAFAVAACLTPERPSWRFRHLGYMPHVFSDVEAVGSYLEELNTQLDEAHGARFEFDWRRCLEDGFCPPFGISHQGRCCRHLKEKYATLFARHFPQSSRHSPSAVRQGSRPRRTTNSLDAANRPEVRDTDRLRIGFLLTPGQERGFLRNMEHIVARLDRQRFQAVVVCPQSGMKACRQTIDAEHVEWVAYPKEFQGAVAAVTEAKCHILYHRQIGTSVANYFQPFARCAPIQCTGWGSHGTTGIDAVDYYLSSDLIEIDGAQSHYTERLFEFHDTFPTCQSRIKSAPATSRSDFNLPNRGALYFCPQRIEKIHPAFDPLLRGILETDGQGTVVMFRGRHPAALERLVARFGKTLGAKLLRRVAFVESLPSSDYYRLLSLADVVLDTPNYSACLTGFDAFSLGIPLVTLPGKLKVQRYALALYRKMGIGDLIVEDESQYITTVVRLGTDEPFGQDIRQKIQQGSHLLFDDPQAIKEHERFFEYAWQHRK
jgi:protein O-GlcNAc transferase